MRDGGGGCRVRGVEGFGHRMTYLIVSLCYTVVVVQQDFEKHLTIA